MVSILLFAIAAAVGADPQSILARVKEASGGAAWDRISSTHAKVTLETGGLKGTAESWEDVRTGRSVNAYHLGPVSGAGGFDGKTVWTQDSSKQVRIEEGGEAREAAANDAYRSAMGYFYRERWPAQLESLGEKSEGGRRFLVVRATPKGGRPYDIWIDAGTHLIDHTVEKAAIETRTVYSSDYREVQGVRGLAQRSTNGERSTTSSQIQSIESVPVADARSPARAAAPISRSRVDLDSVPFELLNNHICQVKLNGKAPFRMLATPRGQYRDAS
jgi:hypothetical protein